MLKVIELYVHRDASEELVFSARRVCTDSADALADLAAIDLVPKVGRITLEDIYTLLEENPPWEIGVEPWPGWYPIREAIR